MRYAMVVAAFGMVLGAPVLAPTALMNVAAAQPVPVPLLRLDQTRTLAAQLQSAAGDAIEVAAILSVSTASADEKATALASAAAGLAQSNPVAAAALVTTALNLPGVSAGVAGTVGTVASTVATNLATSTAPDAAAASASVATAVSSNTSAQTAYTNSGGPDGSTTAPVVQSTAAGPSVAEVGVASLRLRQAGETVILGPGAGQPSLGTSDTGTPDTGTGTPDTGTGTGTPVTPPPSGGGGVGVVQGGVVVVVTEEEDPVSN